MDGPSLSCVSGFRVLKRRLEANQRLQKDMVRTWPEGRSTRSTQSSPSARLRASIATAPAGSPGCGPRISAAYSPASSGLTSAAHEGGSGAVKGRIACDFRQGRARDSFL